MQEPVQQLVGAELAAVVFVRDYIQLSFDGPMLNAHTPIAVTTDGVMSVSGDDQFRNRLCGLIGRSVTNVRVRDDEFRIELFGGSSISLSLRPAHYAGPEAVVFHGASGEVVVF